MGLSNELISQFVKITKDDKKTKSESTVYGTTKKYNGSMYVHIDGADPELLTPVKTTANVKEGERVTVMIKNHTATITGNITSPSASNKDVEKVNDTVSEFGTIIASKANISDLEVERGRIDTLVTENVTIKDTLTANEADITSLKTDKLDASYATIIDATVENLNAANAKLDNLDANYATVEALNATNANVDNLEADVADIDTLIFGSAAGDTIQTSFSNAVIAQLGNAQIKSAMIDNVSASKITSGNIITNNVVIRSEDGQLAISDETIRIQDDARTRVQIGKDASGDYSINVWDDAGNLMFSKGGITESAIKEAIIRNDMVSDTANIAAHKLDIDSLFDEINDSTKTIKSTKVYLDEEGQTLDVAFKSMSTDVENLQNEVSSQGTEISVIQGQISSKIWQQDINTAKNEIGETTTNLSTKYTTLEQELDGVSTTVADHTSQISNKADSSTVTNVSNKVTALETNLDGFKSTVSDTYSTKTDFNNLQIGGRNVIRGTRDFVIDESRVNGWRNTHNFTITHDAESNCNVITKSASGLTQNSIKSFESSKYPCKKGDRITFSVWMKVKDVDAWDAKYPYIFEVFNSEGIRVQFYDAYITSTNTNSPTLVNDVWTRFTATFLVTAEDAVNMAMRLALFRNGEISFKLPKVEFGSKATDWTPAPEDMATASEVSSLTNRVTSAETSITQTSEILQQKASKTEVTEAVKGIIVGGRNLYENSGDLKQSAMGGYQYTYGESTIGEDSTVPSGKYLAVTSTAIGTSGNFGPYMNEPFGNYVKKMVEGETYTASVWVKCSTAKTKGVIRAEFLNNVTDIAPPLSTEWQRYVTTGVYNGHTTSGVAITFYYGTEFNVDDVFYISSPMIEIGNKATDWKPAPEDLATTKQLSSVETRVTSAETSITQNANDISSIATRTSNVEGRLGTAETKTTQNADSISAVAARTTTNEKSIAALELNADGFSVRLGNTETDVSKAQSTADEAKANAAVAHSAANTAQSTANTAKNDASAANGKAETAQNKAFAAQNTANTANSTANSALSRTYLKSDVDNYSELNDDTASTWGFDVDDTSDGHWFTMQTLARDKRVSSFHQCNGGESFKITYEISTSCKGNSSNGGTDSVYRGTAVGLYGFDAEGTSVGINYSTRVMGTADAPVTQVSSTVRVSSNARKFYVFIQTESYANFSGSIKIRKLRVEKIDMEASKTATNYLGFDSTSGLVVGDLTGNTLGKNVAIDSDSVDIRDGETVMASFGANTLTLGQNAEDSVINLCDGAGTISTIVAESTTSYPHYDGIAIESQRLDLIGKRIYLNTSYTNSTSEQSSHASCLSSTSGFGSEYKITESGDKNQTGVSSAATSNSVSTHTDIYSIHTDGATGDVTSNHVSVYPTRTQFSQPISINGNKITGANKVLWSGGYYMTEGHSCTLSENVSDQTNGIVLVFSEYIDGAVSNTAFHCKFVPKKVIASHNGLGHCFQMSSSNLAYFATKYLYISNTKVSGHANNTLTGAGTSGITRSNGRFVLRYIIGV